MASISITVKSIIRNLSAPTEFCLVIFICFGLTIAATSVWLIHHLSPVAPAPAHSVIQLKNDYILCLRWDCFTGAFTGGGASYGHSLSPMRYKCFTHSSLKRSRRKKRTV